LIVTTALPELPAVSLQVAVMLAVPVLAFTRARFSARDGVSFSVLATLARSCPVNGFSFTLRLPLGVTEPVSLRLQASLLLTLTWIGLVTF
jgi:hypothetical protein